MANFIGESNVVEAELLAKGEERGVKLGDIILELPSGMHIPGQPGPVKLSLRPEILHIESEDYAGSAQCLDGEVTQSAYMGPVIEYSINTQAGELFTRDPASATQHSLEASCGYA
ncbi:MAG: TOBE domain-containing protein [Deltaproteobacteria bacterium]|nr:TOBE domain-containing protein [Deltaproteobacteria bacterium]